MSDEPHLSLADVVPGPDGVFYSPTERTPEAREALKDLIARLREYERHLSQNQGQLVRVHSMDVALLQATIRALLSPAPDAPARRRNLAEMVAAVEEEVGMGAGAWDTIDPQEIIGAVVRTVCRQATPTEEPHENV